MTVNTACTVIRDEKIVGVYPCMWQETEGLEIKKYGAENADVAAIFIPDISADVQKFDKIYRDENSENSLVVTSVTRHDYGSENMRHVKVGAR